MQNRWGLNGLEHGYFGGCGAHKKLVTMIDACYFDLQLNVDSNYLCLALYSMSSLNLPPK